MRVKAAKWGNSVAVRLPREALRSLDIAPGAELDLSIGLRSITISPVGRTLRVPSLEDMVAEARRLGPGYEPETIDWGPDVGAEIIHDEYSHGEIQPPVSVQDDDGKR